MMDRLKKDIVELTRCGVEEYRAMRKLPFAVMADNVRSMHNIGSLFRTGDAFRVAEIVLGGISGTPPHPEIAKTALGADEAVAWRHVTDSVAETARMKADGWTVCVLEQTHNSMRLQDFHPAAACEGGDPKSERKYLLVVGNEVKGVDQRIVDMADHVLEIPQEGTKHSLNVATSAAIAMFHFYCEVVS